MENEKVSLLYRNSFIVEFINDQYLIKCLFKNIGYRKKM